MLNRRIVVTGLGTISSSGSNAEELWKNISAGKSGIVKIDEPEFQESETKIGGYIKDFQAAELMDKKDVRRTDRVTQFGYIASKEALRQAHFQASNFDLGRCGIVLGTGIGGISSLLENYDKLRDKGPRRVSPITVPKMISNMVAGFVSIKTGFRGLTMTPISACATGNQAIGEAFYAIKNGRCDAILAGGTEASITPLSFAGFDNMHALSTNNEHPEEASRPFDKDRDGFVMGEGAGVLFLEELEHAIKRHANILGEIVGYGVTSDAYHMTTPKPEGAVASMKEALRVAELEPEQIEYINAHATSTGIGDISETKAIKEAFGKHATELLISSTKSMTGHLLGAAGGIESVIAIESLQNGILPPTINLENQDEDCDLNYISNKAISKNVDYVLSNGFGFGGHNASLIFKKA
ncbi:beta-ketoacyl-[acyl-carrier-protein] synthase II [Oenococcus oeni]|uniref:beta-ketoacyl-ACP synthase II n=1 Tax=Oenococcus oeni TaxID=1247 RepID=UPI00095367D2|nr:beta-ketoacyl-ACP synthase II [Oenococcus oeni]OLQ38377.1 beta-ketoacyl-[acyl-carrier-protein] synthase II [Oenococcus oeni]